MQIDHDYDGAWLDAINCDPELAMTYIFELLTKYHRFIQTNPTMHLPHLDGPKSNTST